MRQETIVKTYLTFNELNDKQKVKALDDHRDCNINYGWWESTFQDRTNILKMLGFLDVEIGFSGFNSQGDGACFTGHFVVPKTPQEIHDRITKVKEYAPNFELHDFDKLDTVDLGVDEVILEIDKFYYGYYCHSSTVRTDDDKVTKFVRDFSDQLYKDLESEYNYLRSDEQVAESLIMNEVEFDLDEYQE